MYNYNSHTMLMPTSCLSANTLAHSQTFNPAYKDRFSAISNFVMVKFAADTMVQPKESEVGGINNN